MNPIEIVGEICALDSDCVRGWRWLLSARYRETVRAGRRQHHPLLVVVGVFETLLFMAAEIVALVFLVRWLLRL